MAGVQCQLVICRGHIGVSESAFHTFLQLMVLHVGGGPCTHTHMLNIFSMFSMCVYVCMFAYM